MMSAPRAEFSRVINASPATVYRVFSNYLEHHPRILPKKFFASLKVEKGGQGAGTVFTTVTQFMGAKQTLHMQVTEPEPGRVLQEEDKASGVLTTFTVAPAEGNRSLVTLATEWTPKSGLQGLVERYINPSVARRMFQDELDLVEAYAQTLR